MSGPRVIGCRRRRRIAQSVATLSLFFVCSPIFVAAQTTADLWKQTLQEQVRGHDLEAAQQTAERRISEAPADLEAHGWRARVLAWRGQWAEAEFEYRFVLRQAPNDTEILTGLADVLSWQQRAREALQVLDQARAVQPTQIDILIRRARLLAGTGRTREARAEFRHVLAIEPSNEHAKSGLSGLAELTTHELRVGADIDTFNYNDPAQAYAIHVRSQWRKRWSTLIGTSFYQRFGESATKFTASTAYQFTARDWINIGGAVARDHGVIPRRESFFEYGHAFKLRKGWLRGLESSYQQRWLWYRDARILTLNTSQLIYFPRDWTGSLSITGARSGFSGTTSDWRPSGMAKLSFPLHRRLTANTFFAVGSENFALVDQIGSFSAHTYGGGLRCRVNGRQDISGYVARQDRSNSRTQTSFGVSYGFRF
jgi:tetratricopeptide (TPR) repeat protein